ncbi:gas vesicle protein GvpG [Acetomicrobium sp.]|uniref:gas vesicle protein GvpG n=1 Tax=Acetomicrobium sp. TaxID=1872099 RepID=UPI001BCC2929|nr:gas vesicle protein GvpG [Acetomicrobium sp.]
MVIKLLWDLLVGVPATLTREILAHIKEEIDQEMLTTEGSIRQRLQELQVMLESGEITEEEYDDLEAKLIERLKAIRQHNRGQGG